jgi:CrcB protein
MIGYLYVGLGGAIGAVLRVLLSSVLPAEAFNIPLKILIINVLGCFLMGILTNLFNVNIYASLNMKHFLIQGLLGGFTTFSAFSLEFFLLYEKGMHILAIIYAAFSVAVSFIFFFIGLKFIKLFF